MFEGSNAAYSGFLEGVNRRMAKDADAAVQSWKDATASWKAACGRLESQLEQANARIAELELALAVKTASAAGSVAVVEAFKASHPQSPLLVQDGTFRNGAVRRRSNSIWARAFDEAARKLGISNPEAHRIS